MYNELPKRRKIRKYNEMKKMNDSYCFYFSLEFVKGDTGERCCRSGHTGDPYAGSTTVPDARPLQFFQYLMKHVA